MDENRLKDIKTIINSLVIPHPNGVGLRVLCNEYRDIEGDDLPYRAFGYTSVTAFLKSMPDVIRMYGNVQDFHSVTVFPMISEDNKHIVDLVKGQNKTKRGGRRSHSLTPNRYHHLNGQRRPPLMSSAFRHNSGVHFGSNAVNSRSAFQPFRSTGTQLRSAVTVVPNKPSGAQQSFIAQRPIIATATTQRPITGTAPQRPVISTAPQRPVMGTAPQQPVMGTAPQRPVMGTAFQRQYFSTAPPHPPPQTTAPLQPLSNGLSNITKRFENFSITKHTDQIPNVPQVSIGAAVDKRLSNGSQVDGDHSDTDSQFSSISNYQTKKAIQNFRHILMLHENGINAIDFPEEYEKQFKQSFDSRIWGFKTPMDLFYSMKDIFAIETNDKSECILHDIRFKTFEKPVVKVKTDASAVHRLREIPDVILARIMSLVQKHMPFGLPVPTFENTYSANFGSISLNHMRISDSSYLFDVLKSNELPVEVKIIDGISRVFLTSYQDLIDWTAVCCRAHRYNIPIILCDTPSTAVRPGENFSPCAPPEKFKSGDNDFEYVAVYISSAISPAEIFLQFKAYHKELEALMGELDVYETLPEDKWAVPYQYLCVGLPVVTRFPGDRHWHRARISKLYPNQKRMVSVSFVDYGGLTVTDYKNLRLMRREFLKLPIQALKVSLYGIKPLCGQKDGWTVASRDKVLTFSQPFYPLACTLVDNRAGVHYVALCDTNSAQDVFVHNVLVDNNHAVFDEDGDEP